ncbi:gliding motility-associated ABC transporter substrate-binding protein GldG [uncultured Eudoraea sp.]|uniref:gliding motility-associated ABC transporter substrate-binding protein GldG n=1 Tax=uncultured Eudoraea sp. TaxID=1035614 RepID=UPI00262C8766|nr:gliding motility-associated ABC transporter substrate-binding protein GldG [uncultured Eudoraea sp.]
MKYRSVLISLLLGLLIIIGLNGLTSIVNPRVDLTADSRYTLSETTRSLTDQIDSPLIIDVLLGGDLPPEFSRLQTEVSQFLNQLHTENSLIKINFVSPLEDAENRSALIAELQSRGLTPANVSVEEEGKTTQELVFPWAMANYKNQTVRVPLLINKLGSTTEDRINASVQELEYAFADALTKLTIEEKKRIAILKGNGQLDDIYIADLLGELRNYYNLGVVTLDSVATNAQGTLESLNNFDMAILAKPSLAFTEEEKYVLDQFIVQGGKSIWLMDGARIELDSLLNETGSSIALPNELNINDLLFRYGVRLNPNLVNDMYCTQIVLASGEGSGSQYNPLPWVYHPMVFPWNDHPITENIEALRFLFSSSLDTVESSMQKTVLLRSSPLSKSEGIPKLISLELLNSAPDPKNYSGGGMPLAVLLEGPVHSAYTNRIAPVQLSDVKDTGPENSILVIADGDVIKNQLNEGRPIELGYDKWTNNFYGNKTFLLNAINYMLDERGLVALRSRAVNIPTLDLQKVADTRSTWQMINIGVPLMVLLGFGFTYKAWRKRKYGR